MSISRMANVAMPTARRSERIEHMRSVVALFLIGLDTRLCELVIAFRLLANALVVVLPVKPGTYHNLTYAIDRLNIFPREGWCIIMILAGAAQLLALLLGILSDDRHRLRGNVSFCCFLCWIAVLVATQTFIPTDLAAMTVYSIPALCNLTMACVLLLKHKNLEKKVEFDDNHNQFGR